MILFQRPNCVRPASALPHVRQLLLLGTILGAGVVVVSPPARAADVNDTINTPQTSPYSNSVSGSDNLTLTVNTPGSIAVPDSSAVYVTSDQGNIYGLGAVTSTNGRGIYARTAGSINIGGDAGLSNAITAGSNGIEASASVTITIKTASGGNISSGGVGIKTVNSSLSKTLVATTITIGQGSTITRANAAISAKTDMANVTITNSGTIKGTIEGLTYNSASTGTFTLNNSGTITLASGQSISSFTTANQSGGVLTGTGSFGDVTAQSGSKSLQVIAQLRLPAPPPLNAH